MSAAPARVTSATPARAAVAAAMLATLGTSGCVGKEPEEKTVDPAYIQNNLLPAPPATLSHPVNADLGGYVVYLGAEADRTALAPGTAVTVVHYWKVLSPPGPEWRVFTHLLGGGDSWMNLDRTDMRIGYPPSEWKAGDVIRDEQKFTLAADWNSPYAQLSVGLYRQGSSSPDDRMPIRSGPADKESRVLAIRFSVEGRGGAEAGSTRAERLQPVPVRRASGPIAIDGTAAEKDWQVAVKSPPFVGAEGGAPVEGATRARLLWDDANLYAFIEVEDTDVYSQYAAQDDPLWKADAVELFIDADRNRRGYVELQVNPRNAHFDAWFPQTRAQASHPEWTSRMRSAVKVHGTLDRRDDRDRGWDVEIAIPLADVKGMDAAMQVATPPAVGDRWRLNLVRVEKPRSGSIAASSWNPIPVADFHSPGRMLTVVFADAEGAVPAAAPNRSAAPSPPAAKPTARPEPAKPRPRSSPPD